MPTPASENRGPTRAIRLSDIAQSLGLATSTVSMALADDLRIAEVTRKTVRKKADELGFRPNPNAQRLLKGFNVGEVAILMHDIDQGILTQIGREIRFLLAEQGYRPSLHISDSPGGGTEGQAAAVRTLRHERPQAILCFLHDIAPETLEELRRYRAEGGTLASYFNPIPMDCDQVVFDEEHGTRQAVERLVALGHRRIGFCTHGELDPDSRRYRAFLAAMGDAGLPVPPEYLMPGGLYEAGGCEIARRFVALERRPTAMHIVNDSQVSGFVAELYRLGLRVPQYVSVIGTDDIAAASCGWVPISTVSVPSGEIAERVVALLASRLKGEYEGSARIEKVRGELIERETTAPPRAIRDER